MSREIQTVSIGGRTYFVKPLLATPARHVAHSLMTTVAKAAGSVGDVGGLTDVESDGFIGKVVAGIASLVASVEESELDRLTGIFATDCMVENGPDQPRVKLPDVIEEYFAGGQGLSDWTEWMEFCIEVNCAGFFAGIGARLQRFGLEAKERQSQSTSTGGSTE